MIHTVWIGLFLVGIVYAALTGNIAHVSTALFEGAQEGLNVAFSLLGILTLWMGILNVARKAGLLDALARLLRPLIRLLFPDVPRGHAAEGYLLANIAANLLGMGNAATPFGIKAMQELDKLNPEKGRATRPMITLLALNTASVSLFPTTVIGIRAAAGAAQPADILPAVVLASFLGSAVAVLVDRYYQWREGP